MDKLSTARHVQFFKAVSHPVRLHIVHLLADGERCVCDFEQDIEMDMSSISRHLKQLNEVDIIESERRGKQVFYRLKAKCILSFLDCIDSENQSFCSSK